MLIYCTLLCFPFYPQTRFQCIRRSQCHQSGRWCCHHWRCLSESRLVLSESCSHCINVLYGQTNNSLDLCNPCHNEVNTIIDRDKIGLTFTISCDSSKSVTSLADTWMLSESPEQRYLKHHSRRKLGQGPPCARLAAMTSPAVLINGRIKQLHIN